MHNPGVVEGFRDGWEFGEFGADLAGGKAEGLGDVDHGGGGGLQKLAGAGEAALEEVSVGWDSGGFAEGAGKVVLAEAGDGGEAGEAEVLVEVLFDEVGETAVEGTGEAAAVGIGEVGEGVALEEAGGEGPGDAIDVGAPGGGAAEDLFAEGEEEVADAGVADGLVGAEFEGVEVEGVGYGADEGGCEFGEEEAAGTLAPAGAKQKSPGATGQERKRPANPISTTRGSPTWRTRLVRWAVRSARSPFSMKSSERVRVSTSRAGAGVVGRG